MKKILFITLSMVCGGVERTLLNLLSSLDQEKYAIDLLLVEKNGIFLESVPKHIRVIQAEMPEVWRTLLQYNKLGIKSGFLALWKQKKYRTAIRFLSLGVIDRLSKRFFKKGVFFPACVKRTKLPKDDYDVVCDYHGYAHYTTYLALAFPNAKKFSWVHVEKIDQSFSYLTKQYNQFDAIFCVSPKCLTNFAEKFPYIPSDRLVLLYNLILKDKILALFQKPPSVEYDTKGKFVITSVGRLSTQKGFDLAIEAAHILKQRGKSFMWIIVGEGPERPVLESLIARYDLKNEVILHGLDNNPYTYLAMADLYVQSSRYEGFATTLSEAVLIKKPIVSTLFSGVDQQVIEGKNGLLASFDPKDLADKIQYVMEHEDVRQAFAKGCNDIQLPMDQTLETLDTLFN